MSEDKKYKDELWNDLPLPDSKLAWEKMEVLLDKDGKRRQIVGGCGIQVHTRISFP